MEKIIECDKITHYYGNRLIYKDLSFDVEKGKVLGLLGKNGTGKTTIINILNGYLKPRSGVCRLFGEDMQHITPQTKACIGLLLEGHVQHTYFNDHRADRTVLCAVLSPLEPRRLLRTDGNAEGGAPAAHLAHVVRTAFAGGTGIVVRPKSGFTDIRRLLYGSGPRLS